ncbi:hypothetical protein Trydic_g21196 [Trypoxylus dichotomus]
MHNAGRARDRSGRVLTATRSPRDIGIMARTASFPFITLSTSLGVSRRGEGSPSSAKLMLIQIKQIRRTQLKAPEETFRVVRRRRGVGVVDVVVVGIIRILVSNGCLPKLRTMRLCELCASAFADVNSI